MAEPTPTLRMSGLSLVNEVAFRIYGTRSPDSTQKAHCLILVNNGYRDFLGETDWDFLHPATTLSVTAEDTETDLPAMFGGLEGNFCFAPNAPASMERVPLEGIYRLRAAIGTTAVYPSHYALAVKDAALTGQLWQAHWYPTPSGALSLYYQYTIEPMELASESTSIPLGTARDHGAILAAAMKWAEADKSSEPGWWSKEYDRRLMACLKRQEGRQVKTVGRLRPQNRPNVVEIVRGTVTME